MITIPPLYSHREKKGERFLQTGNTLHFQNTHTIKLLSITLLQRGLLDCSQSQQRLLHSRLGDLWPASWRWPRSPLCCLNSANLVACSGVSSASILASVSARRAFICSWRAFLADSSGRACCCPSGDIDRCSCFMVSISCE